MALVRENIAKMDGYTPGEQPRDRTYIKLNTNENPYPPSPAVADTLKALDPAQLRRYPEPLSADLRQAAGQPFGLSPDWVIAGNGSDDLLTIAMRTFVDQGSRVAYPTPSYSLYPILADLQGAEHAVVELDSRFNLPEDTGARIAGANLFIICRPNAPTGNAFALDAMHRVCREFAGVVWIDEAYVDFAESHCLDFVRHYPNVVVSRTVSKSYSLAGIRLGVAFAQPDLIREMLKVKDSYNVNMLTQLVGLAALSDRAHMLANAERICATRGRLCERLGSLGCVTLPSQTNFILTRPPIPAATLFVALREHGFLVRYFDQDRIRDYIRVTIGTEEEMDAFVEAAAAILKGKATT